MLSPGPLSAAHAKLEGLDNCVKCHQPGHGVSAQLCLKCHQPIAERIVKHAGVHRDVKDNCITCHTEHAGRDADIRPIDPKSFDHAAETGFTLDGRHARIACAKCHTTRSFLGLKPACGSCHKDTHRGELGADCARCHDAGRSFKDSGRAFNHALSGFALVGAHAKVACEKCHHGGKWKGLTFARCSSCHRDPHHGELGARCSSCHTPTAWATRKIDHARTRFPLRGAHATVPCQRCHIQPATKVALKFSQCRDCHTDPHKGRFPEDCASCHTEGSFSHGATFDHTTRTKFALTGRHAEIACVACHHQPKASPRIKPLLEADFRGLSTACVTCHTDPHAGELGNACASCHDARSFHVTTFKHPRSPEFFGGQHASVQCAKCHREDARPRKTDSPVSGRIYRSLSTECASCHKDVHLGQLGKDCATCHTVEARGFRADRFNHSRTRFHLEGKHLTIKCEQCHRRETAAFPSGTGEAVRYSGMGTNCVSCHHDAHRGELGTRCETCHSTDAFKVTSYTHRADGTFFRGSHASVACVKCHPEGPSPGTPEGEDPRHFASATRQCANCHEDPHRGELGADCTSCHDVARKFQSASRAFHKATLLPLEGRHLAVPCADCHLNGQIRGTPTRCFDCHWIRRQDDVYRTRLGEQCVECHRPTSWTAVTWDHGTATGVVLAGAHRTLDCVKCHTGGRFDTGLPTACVGCHLDDYRRTKQPDHVAAGFPTTCDTCHLVSDPGWDSVTFEHTSYPLVGVHAQQPCQACHSNGVYQGLPSQCVDCHLADYQKTTQPNHASAGFATTCQDCHHASDPNWNNATFEHTTYQLVGVHAQQPCQACHANGVYQGLPSQCVDCHLADYQKTSEPNHETAGFATTCQDCHHASDPNWNNATFEHTTYQLVGVHAQQPCQACHANGVYQGLPSQCVDCHLADYQKTSEPNHSSAGFPTTCETCHHASDPNWNNATFEHTTYQLVGVHAQQPCQACHSSGVYQGLPSQCIDCHLADYQGTTDPNHQTAGFPTTCDTCHHASDPNWNNASFEHTTYQLVGVHAQQPCQACHSSGVYQGLPSQCVDCHLADYQKTTEPNHASAGLPTTCQTCHNAADPTWGDGTFDHSSYPLVGVHAQQPCQACHSSGVYQGLPSQCVDCHLSDYQGTTDPNHQAAGFATTCQDCHHASDPNWNNASFEHTTYQLVGVHAQQPCQACHSNGVYQGLPSQCVDCHLADYQGTTDPNHQTAGFPTTCQTCHNAADSSWGDGTFDHSSYPLVGVHAQQPCQACHSNGVYQGLPSQCVDCHLSDYQGASDPNHVAAGFPTTCQTCHNAADPTWGDGTFDHSSYPLVGVHAQQPCQACHTSGVYQGLPSDCVDCHLSDYQQTTDPNHQAAGFPTTCDLCHNAADPTWNDGNFDHSSYPLVGVHAQQPCVACHSSGVYQGLPSDCVDCHLSDYQQTTDPNHQAAGFPTTCDLCHNAADPTWNDGTFDHSSYPLVGVHAQQPCVACHSSGIYQGLPSDCVDCHLSDYQGATDPNHVAAGFPTTCDLCHNAADPTWNDGNFDHVWFPITSGPHSNRLCSECHPDPQVFAVFTCTVPACHPRSVTDEHHSEVTGYVYESAACYSCHPNGVSDHFTTMPSHVRTPRRGRRGQ